MSKVPECSIWCPSCKLYYAKVYRVELKEGHYGHEKMPKDAPSKCTVCEKVLERTHAPA